MLPQEEELFRRAKDYEHLRDCRGWERILEYLNERSARALNYLRDCQSSDPLIVMALRRKWEVTEKLLRDIQYEVISSIASRDDYIKTLKEMHPNKLQDIINEEEFSNARSEVRSH